MSIARGSLILFIVAISSIAAACGPERPTIRDSKDSLIERFKVSTDGSSFLIVPVTVRGITFEAALDTGTSYSIYDSSLRDLLGAELHEIAVDAAHRIDFGGGEPGLPWIYATIPKVGATPFQVDSGMVGGADGVLAFDLFRPAVQHGDAIEINKATKFGASDSVVSRCAQLRPPVILGEREDQRHAIYNTAFAEGVDETSYLGARFFSRCVATFDFPHGLAYFEPPSSSNMAFSKNDNITAQSAPRRHAPAASCASRRRQKRGK